MTLQSDTFLSVIAKEKLPLFIREEYEKFSLFIQKYYEWFESGDRPYAVVSTQSKRMDINDTNELDAFFDQYAKDFSKNIRANKSLFIKTLKDLYQSKGAEAAFRYYFRTVYDKDVEFYYPKVDVLRASDGKWRNQISIRVVYNPSVARLSGARILGKTSNATATVESASSYFIGVTQIVEMFLSDIQGTFVINEVIEGIPVGETQKATSTIIPVFTGIQITNPGTGYRVGDVIPLSGGTGIEAAARIKSVFRGSVESLQIVSGGVGYQVGDIIAFSSEDAALSASARVKNVISGAITEIEILSKGFNYARVPTVSVISATGFGANIVVANTNIGGIKEVEVLSFGVNYSGVPTANFSSLGDGNATGFAIRGAMCRYPGSFAGNDGFLSDTKFIQDGRYYQDFSYVLKTGIEISKYSADVKKLIHPAGMTFFGQLQDQIDVPIGEGDIFPLTMMTQRFDQYLLSVGLIDWFRATEDFNELDEVLDSLGPTYQYFDENKLRFQSEVGSGIYHFFQEQIKNFTGNEMRQAFDFVPDGEFEQSVNTTNLFTFDSTLVKNDSTLITYDTRDGLYEPPPPPPANTTFDSTSTKFDSTSVTFDKNN